MMLSAKTRSYSSTSSSSSSSATSRADDLYDRLLIKATVDVWSAGNLRINGRDQSLPAAEAEELLATLKGDSRMLAFIDFDGEDWKASYRLAPPTPPAQ
ncbi:hypothetical protein A1Q2_06778 [Trichosporon asahii var. asahii CBS 8904]|uniref:Uncharacterized protein n=1 Tax=Trichosporon asahii var. asahii (strain CBS 8904) TaxID=1220162 RepID=K1V4W6_TRIAC|nr:hypothetical protein A1Q2_06778 [Trichosporon asahii var. asahii CBS 8904]